MGLVGSLGGALSLYLGVALVMMFELVELALGNIQIIPLFTCFATLPCKSNGILKVSTDIFLAVWSGDSKRNHRFSK